MVITGGTRASDFTTSKPVQAGQCGSRRRVRRGPSPPDGNTLLNSTYFGGLAGRRAPLAAAVDGTGNIVLAGQTWSGDFPSADGLQRPLQFRRRFRGETGHGCARHRFRAERAPVSSPGIEAGSWAMIKGVNLANTTAHLGPMPISRATIFRFHSAA
ncbi:MAG: hypothetical protein WDO73_26070 [Ignavibacteriota bacterium]